MIQSVAIRHDEFQSGKYRLLADFFRLCGILVYDDSGMKLRKELQKQFDIVFVVSEKQNESLENIEKNGNEPTETSIDVSNVIILGSDNDNLLWDLDLSDEKSEQKIYLRTQVIDNIAKLKKTDIDKGFISIITEQEKEVLKILADFYIDHNIMRNRVALSTFLGFKDILFSVLGELIDAYTYIIKLLKGDRTLNENVYFWFACRYLEHLINETCDFLHRDMVFDTDSVVAMLQNQANKYDGVEYRLHQANLYYLTARFYECYFAYREKSIGSYKKAEELETDTVFSSYASYRLGRSYEKRRGDWKTAIREYRDSIKLEPGEYRAAYKIAVYEWKQNRSLKAAYTQFRLIDEILKNKSEKNALQPREAEYLYKAWHFIGKLIEESPEGTRFEDNVDSSFVVDKLEKIIGSVKDVEHKNKNYEYIFGKEAKLFGKDVRNLLAVRVAAVCEEQQL